MLALPLAAMTSALAFLTPSYKQSANVTSGVRVKAVISTAASSIAFAGPCAAYVV